MHPEASAAVRVAVLSFPVMKMTGTEIPTALRWCRSSIPDPSLSLMTRMTQTALSMSVWFLKASADEKGMGS